MTRRKTVTVNWREGLSELYKSTIDDFLEQGDKIPTPEEFIMNCYENEEFDNEELSAWFENPENPSDEEMEEFINDLVNYFHLYRIFKNKKESKLLKSEINSRDAILRQELNKIYEYLENEHLSDSYRDFLEDKKDRILEQLGESKNIEDSSSVFAKSNAKKVIEFFYDNDGSEIDVEDALEELGIDYEDYGESIDDLPDDVLSKVYYFLKKEYQEDIQKHGKDVDVPEAAYDIFNLNRVKLNIDAKKIKDELLDTLLDFYRFDNGVDLDTAKVEVIKRSEDCLKCIIKTDLDRRNLKKLAKKLDPIVQKYDENTHFDASIYSEDNELIAYVWGE